MRRGFLDNTSVIFHNVVKQLFLFTESQTVYSGGVTLPNESYTYINVYIICIYLSTYNIYVYILICIYLYIYA